MKSPYLPQGLCQLLGGVVKHHGVSSIRKGFQEYGQRIHPQKNLPPLASPKPVDFTLCKNHMLNTEDEKLLRGDGGA